MRYYFRYDNGQSPFFNFVPVSLQIFIGILCTPQMRICILDDSNL